jgi:type I restriction enzyme M protein
VSSEDFRKVIDDARQILVGKLPNPQDQIDAITYALMYKFMSDVDDQSASLPMGKRTYFSGDYEKYSWHNLMRADGQDQLILYREAIEKMSRNPGLPALFREIFNGAMLKFNDPRTLRLFLKEMDKFKHGTNDDLGDVYEYLLSLMGSQGGLGQFRTPRHIIKFIVDVVDPDKTDRIMDPAAGTGGFLIEAYKHTLAKHDGVDEGGKHNDEKRLTAAELDRVHKNFRGFDIDATMIRTARVNMYLHGFKTPDIIEHDTLTSEDYWSDRYDIILANPPFMTPKGGIQPHKKFGVQSSRAEVLFVDYIASHLKPNGRAGIIVPEGIIFQAGSSYKSLRKELLDKGLWCVVSLPVGVFNPYTKTTKTSILLIDKALSQKLQDVLFVKVEADGFDLGATRTPIPANDLPAVKKLVGEFARQELCDSELTHVIMSREELMVRPGHSLSVLHDIEDIGDSKHSSVIGDILKQKKGTVNIDDDKEYRQVTVKMNGRGVVLRRLVSGAEIKTKSQSIARTGDFIMSKIDARHGAFGIVPEDLDGAIVTADFPLFSVNEDVMNVDFLNVILQSPQFIKICQTTSIGTSNRKRLKIPLFLSTKIPLPSIELQRTVVAQIKEHEKVIDRLREEIDLQEEKIRKAVADVWA